MAASSGLPAGGRRTSPLGPLLLCELARARGWLLAALLLRLRLVRSGSVRGSTGSASYTCIGTSSTLAASADWLLLGWSARGQPQKMLVGSRSTSSSKTRTSGVGSARS